MKKIGIISNNQNPRAIKTAKKVYDYLKERENEIYLLNIDVMHREYSLPAFSESEFSSEVEVIISVGGDGTFLRAARYSFEREIPTMGINMGNLGFLAEIDTSNMYKALENILNDDYKIEERMLIEGRLYRNGKLLSSEELPYLALNEFVVNRSMLKKIIKIKIIINGVSLMSFGADGVIISTPTGSTAYSLSAGGPIVEPKSEVLIITPICAHTLFSRSMIINPENELEIWINSKDENANLSVDGVRTSVNVLSGDVFKVKKSNLKLKLVTFDKNIFFKVFKEKLLGKDQNLVK